MSINLLSRPSGLWEEEARGIRDGVLCLRLRKDLDLSTEAPARMRLARVCLDDAVRSLALRAGVDRFIDVRGLAVLLEASARMRRGDRCLIVVEPPASLRLMVEALRLSGQLPLAATLAEA